MFVAPSTVQKGKDPWPSVATERACPVLSGNFVIILFSSSPKKYLIFDLCSKYVLLIIFVFAQGDTYD